MELACQNNGKQALLENSQVLLKAWKGYAEKAKGVPHKGMISPSDFTKILPFISMAENLSEDNVRYSLVGTGLVLRNGYDFTGENWLAYLLPPEQEYFMALQKPKFSLPCGLWYRMAMTPKANFKTFYIETLSLPFLKDGNLECSIAVDDEIYPSKVQKYDGWGDGEFKILDMKLVDIGYGLPEEKFIFPK